MAKKYIDADKLKESLKRRYTDITVPVITSEGGLESYYRRREIRDIIKLIDSLQQEQPDFPTTDEEIERFLATHPKVEVPNKYKTPDWLWKKHEQPEVDLEKEINKEISKWTCYEEIGFGARYDAKPFDGRDIEKIARHFYELGLNARKEE